MTERQDSYQARKRARQLAALAADVGACAAVLGTPPPAAGDAWRACFDGLHRLDRAGAVEAAARAHAWLGFAAGPYGGATSAAAADQLRRFARRWPGARPVRPW